MVRDRKAVPRKDRQLYKKSFLLNTAPNLEKAKQETGRQIVVGDRENDKAQMPDDDLYDRRPKVRGGRK